MRGLGSASSAALLALLLLAPATAGRAGPAGPSGVERDLAGAAARQPAGGTDDGLRDLKPLPRPPRPLRVVLAAVALAMAGAALVLVVLVRRWRPAAGAGPPASRPAHAAALEELERLERRASADEAGRRRYCFAASGVIRAYLESRYGIAAAALTREETMAALDGHAEVGGEALLLLGRFLATAERAKFGGPGPSATERDRLAADGRRFVELTAVRRERGEAA